MWSMVTFNAELKEGLKEGHDSIKKIAENQQKYLDGRPQTEQQYLQAAVYNNYYQFVTSSDKFDAAGGTS